MAKKSQRDEMRSAILVHDYAAFCVLDFLDNASHGLDITPAFKARINLLREARSKGAPFIEPRVQQYRSATAQPLPDGEAE